MIRPGPGHEAPEAGNAALELVILAPVIIMLLCLVVAAGRTAIAQGSIDAAARDAARQASLARTPEEAQQVAVASARAELRAEHLNCRPRVNLPGIRTDFGAPLGQPANVTATVTCKVDLSDLVLVLPDLPGGLRLSGTFSSPLDPYRGRSW